VRAAHALVPQEPFEDCAHVVRAAELSLHLRPAAAEPQNGQIADRCAAASLAVNCDGNAALEERLADQELPAPGELRYQDFH
jgi:hypothetical protein